MNEFNVVIPSRLDSKRLPKKALAMINGKPLIRWVYEKAIASDAKIVLIATDSEEIASIAESFGAAVEITSMDSNQIAQMMGYCDLATLSVPILDQEIIDPNVVKVLSDSRTNEALFFKRKIDVNHELERLHRHIGIYAYRVAILRKFSLSPQSEDEKKEKLEQLRAYSLNMTIKVEEAESMPGPDVDTPDDLIRVQSILE